MPLPEKRYFTLAELVKRWGTDLLNLESYAVDEQLEIQVWLSRIVVRVFEPKQTLDGEIVWVETAMSRYKGYVLLHPDEIREVFRLGECTINKFTSLDKRQSYRLYDGRVRHKIRIADLVVAKQERDRFEQAWDLYIDPPKAVVAKEISQQIGFSFPGRPSVMFQIEERLKQRAEKGELEPSLRREAEVLHSWAVQHITGHQVPKPGSIANALRRSYLQLKERALVAG